ncbi:MAG TPA: hypothetical protein VGM86_14040 [Thermoanaerobaculia bacterium]|jgi:uncharacterized protein (TIGR02646 family)
MIRIDRSGASCPEELERDGEEDLPRLRALAAAGGLASKDFDGAIYASPAVKACLWQMQSGKCCYCEREYERKYSDIEHFRPKTEALREGKVKTSGYWWLAYRFDNLYFGCPPCNRTKKTHFPLMAGTRALESEEDPRRVEEYPLLIDPGFENPEDHLTFVWIPGRGYEVAPRDGSERGRRTIEILELDRDDLSEIRRAYYRRHLQQLLERFSEAEREGEGAALTQIRREAATLKAADSPFSLLARIALREV